MKPGRDLDKLIAEKVMGWTEIEEVKHLHLSVPQIVGIKPNELPSPYTGHRQKYSVPEFSTDIGAAWEVVNEMTNRNYFFLVSNSAISGGLIKLGENKIFASFGRKNEPVEHTVGESAPHAICLAALKSIGS